MIFDIIFVLVIGYGIYYGFSKGLIISFSSFFAVLFGILISVRIIPLSSVILGKWLDSDSVYVPVLAFIFSVIVIVLLIHLLARLLTLLLKIVQLNLINRIAGALFGIISGALLSSFLIMIFDFTDIFSFQQKSNSYLWEFLAPVGPMFINVIEFIIPPLGGFLDNLKDFFSTFKS